MVQRKDRRIKYTKMVLRESLLDLLKTKPLNQITITELCIVADINRNTFYSHYNSPYEILDELETEIYDGLMNDIKNVDDLKGIILAACKSLESNKKLSELIFLQLDASKILSKILTSVKNMPVEGVSDINIYKQKSLINIVNVFTERGAIAVIQDWVLGGFKYPAEVVSELISYLIKNVYETARNYRV